MNKEKVPEKFPKIFRSKTDLADIAQRISVLQEKLKRKGRLSQQDAEKLKDFQKIPRREFMKKVGIAGAGVVLGIAGAKKSVDLLWPESREKLSLIDGLKSLVTTYNDWIQNLDGDEVKGADGVKKFTELYNEMITHLDTTTSLPKLDYDIDSSAENVKKFMKTIDEIGSELRSQGCYLYAGPQHAVWKGHDLSFMTVFLGKIREATPMETEQGGQRFPYEYLAIDGFGDEKDSLETLTAPTKITALTYKDFDGTVRVMQYLPAYRNSAKNIYEGLDQHGDSLKMQMSHAAYDTYLSDSAERSIEKIAEANITTSREHEEQHVRDDVAGFEGAALNEETLPKWMIIEMRGLLSPLSGKNPKVALRNIANWRFSSGQYHRMIGDLTWGIVRDVSGIEPEDVQKLSDEDIRSFGEPAMMASEIFFGPIVKEGGSLDPELQSQYSAFIDSIHNKE